MSQINKHNKHVTEVLEGAAKVASKVFSQTVAEDVLYGNDILNGRFRTACPLEPIIMTHEAAEEFKDTRDPLEDQGNYQRHKSGQLMFDGLPVYQHNGHDWKTVESNLKY